MPENEVPVVTPLPQTEVQKVESTISKEVRKVEDFVVHVFKDIQTGIYHMVHPGLVTRPLDSTSSESITQEVVAKLGENNHGAVIENGQPILIHLHDPSAVPAQAPADLTDPVNPAPLPVAPEAPVAAPALDPAAFPAPAPLPVESKN